jgi:hypothetical protein
VQMQQAKEGLLVMAAVCSQTELERGQKEKRAKGMGGMRPPGPSTTQRGVHTEIWVVGPVFAGSRVLAGKSRRSSLVIAGTLSPRVRHDQFRNASSTYRAASSKTRRRTRGPATTTLPTQVACVHQSKQERQATCQRVGRQTAPGPGGRRYYTTRE